MCNGEETTSTNKKFSSSQKNLIGIKKNTLSNNPIINLSFKKKTSKNNLFILLPTPSPLTEEPKICNKTRCHTTIAIIKKGKKKCKTKKNFKVAIPTKYPPHTQKTINSPTKGKTLKKLIITEAPQKDICPHGRTYPKKEIVIKNINKTLPLLHTVKFLSRK